MASLRMSVQEVIDTGFSFVVVVFVLHLFAAVLIGMGFLAIDVSTDEVCKYNEAVEDIICKEETADLGLVIGWLCWVSAIVVLISGYIGLSSKLLTDSIAIGIYKANNADVMGITQHVEENIPPPVTLPPNPPVILPPKLI
tara:strand:+ start:2322 stop:2744 length:423 start_codon:yes stop_codon:yes gene_type:complete